jgi:Raf kinase inhibitor-like YbhB/YbcL family protein
LLIRSLLSVSIAVIFAACSGGGTADPQPDGAGSTQPSDAAAEDRQPASDSPAAPGFPNPSLEVDEATGFAVNSFSIPTAVGTVIGGITAFCEPSDAEITRYGGNISPHVNWKNSPVGTKSLALVVVDPDAPASGELVNKKGAAIPIDFERADFYHWVVADIPAEISEIKEGASGRGVTAGGKKASKKDWGLEGVNSFGLAFAEDAEMKGDYYGWDGPCPPWNDERVHSYVFHLFALDLPSLGLSGPFTAADVLAKVEGHTLAHASFSGIYSINIAPPPAQAN